MTLTAGELLELLKGVPADTPIIISMHKTYTTAKSCNMSEDYDDEHPWKDDGSANRVPVVDISDEEPT